MNYKAVLKSCHVVDAYDGVVGRRLKCVRCKRDLPEAMYTPLRPQRYSYVPLPSQIVLNGVCATCKEQQRGKWVKHPLYTPGLDRYWKKYLQRMKGGATSRGYLVTVDKDDLLGMYLQQEGRCALTGIEMNWWKLSVCRPAWREITTAGRLGAPTLYQARRRAGASC